MGELTEMVAAWGVPVLIATAAMVCDICTGFGGAVKKGEVASGKMREGLWHKAGFYGLIILAALYEVAAAFMNLDVASAGIGVSLPELPAVGAVCVYVLGTEIVSVCENLIVINPALADAPFMRTLVTHDPGSADMTVAVEDFEECAVGAEGSE
ncbi:phage holin family protein [Adlercreutzia sp. R25]|uniref:phage holin family protein n=1 Tax=Adlercreutzia shanghongiae TaxID=3111773 RepID=UPI002DBC719B|nr:phage holin family protein [Adlercreutzia sp. R25]MEC4272969.1 phage holin family protein [Adlercreutzia sp. R25]